MNNLYIYELQILLPPSYKENFITRKTSFTSSAALLRLPPKPYYNNPILLSYFFRGLYFDFLPPRSAQKREDFHRYSRLKAPCSLRALSTLLKNKNFGSHPFRHPCFMLFASSGVDILLFHPPLLAVVSLLLFMKPLSTPCLDSSQFDGLKICY